MSIIRNRRKTVPYVQIEHSILEDEALSWKAKGLLCYLISRPAYWEVRMADLESKSKDGKDSVRTAIKELIEIGYVTREQIRDERGRMIGWEYSVFEFPQPKAGFPTSEKPTPNKKDRKTIRKTKETGKPVTTAKADCTRVEEHKARWKPDQRTKAQKLAALPTPRDQDYPSEDEFNDYLADCGMGLTRVLACRDLYQELCLSKWHKWEAVPRRWMPIKDWRAYMDAMDISLPQI